ncbi:hypothetical protein [Cellulophaga sp. BC115SP]|uniref:hypothetical protein n=1 Tax=Cellulophaga sp. BC115SP TaxID=2683263 RepID=UPI0014136356|nr:hypothetical protein [Cellulophaga sp. BC115SP]NBB31248.1 hypothetical protein [Cellulophaga sp. BC115SP]
MTEQYYKCTLLSDVVLNNKMATEGNMTTLDYIAGSNFLGIVANDIYINHKEKAYKILHTGDVSFGDAHISLDGAEVSYAMPFSLFKDKLDKTKTWVHHLLDKHHFDNFREKGIQLKQERSGYLTSSGHILESPKKNFVLKSAQEREERRSKDGAMFGFESLKAGQVYVFSIRYENAEYQEIVEKFLIGNKRIGKSKTAQYGQVDIQPIANPTLIKTIETPQNYTIVYAESNLCFFNEFGQTTFQPKPKDLGLSGGEICWKKSQIRTYAYSPWNGIRNTPNTQRDCILKGSVFYVKDAVAPEDKINSVGEYQPEGLGRVIYNPAFLKGNESDGDWTFDLFKEHNNSDDKEESTQPASKEPEPTSDLGKFLNGLKKQKDKDLAISKAIHKALNLESSKELMKITPSQWGGIRAYAENTKDIVELEKQIFKDFISHGVALERYWSKGGRTQKFQAIFDDNKQHGTIFFAKYAAEMAKEAQKLKNKK